MSDCAFRQISLSGPYTPWCIYTMERMYFEKESWTRNGFGRTTPIILAYPEGTEYFRGNDVAEFLGYKQPAIEVT